MRNKLLKQAQELRKNQQTVEKQLTYLNTEIQHTKLTRRVAELVIAIVAGGVVTLIIGRLIGIGINRLDIPTESTTPSPASIPYIKDKEACDKREGSIWYEEQCWDFSHRDDW